MTLQPTEEPLSRTLMRNGAITLVASLIAFLALPRSGTWPQVTVLALWFTFGGHWVELFFLHQLQPRLAPTHGAQVAGRLLAWLVGGTLLLLGARMTVAGIGMPSIQLPPWWLGGPMFIGLELVVHALLRLRGLPSVYGRPT